MELVVTPEGEIVTRRTLGTTIRDPESSSRNFRLMPLNGHRLLISGNPCKLLQGHNLWGSDDALGLYFEAGEFIREKAGLFPGVETWRACEFTPPSYTRLDITRSYRFPSQAIAADYFQQVIATARTRHGAPKLYGNETAYFGYGSRRWNMKVYLKLPEIIAQAKRDKRVIPDTLADWARGVIRFELTLRSLEIRENYPTTDLNNSDNLSRIWLDKFDTITLNRNSTAMNQTDLTERDLPHGLQGSLSMWRGGRDLREVLSRRTFYRHRKKILEATGIDIASPPPKQPPRLVQAEPPVLDPAGWDPEPLEGGLVEPRKQLKMAYGFE